MSGGSKHLQRSDIVYMHT